MAKAFMLNCPTTSLGSGSESNLFGYSTNPTTETVPQVNATEQAVFSNMRVRTISGNSGTATYIFRNNTANGNQTFAIAGVIDGEDTVNSDTVAAGNEFNTAYTDTGSNSTISWLAGNVEFSSGHGNFHGSGSNGIVHDIASATRFIALTGFMGVDGTATEANVAWKVRGYTTFEAVQANVSANARTNDSVFRNKVNLANGTGVVTYGTGVTGIITATGLADAITSGQTVGMSLTLLTGVEDLTLTTVLGTFKSTTAQSETFCGGTSGFVRTASATENYVPPGGALQSFGTFTEAQSRAKPGFSAVVSNLRCYISSNTYTGDGTLKLYVNGVATISQTIAVGGGIGWYENTTDTTTIDPNDEISFALDEGTSGSIVVSLIGCTFLPYLHAQACL